MEEARRLDLDEKPGPELQLSIATTFSVAQATDILIKQEPQDLIIPEIPAQEHEEENEERHHEVPNCYGGEEDASHENLSPVTYPEVSDGIMHRAVSPPRYPIDPDEERMERLILFYKKKYNLVDVTVELESCDKIWETLQLIKNIQGSSSEESTLLDASQDDSQPVLPGPHIPYEPTLGNNNKALPDFRFSIKSKKKLYHCITCGKEFNDSQHLRQHAVDEHSMFYNPTKRVYKPREQVPKSIPVIYDTDKNKITETENVTPVICPETQSAVETEPIQSPLIENTESSMSDNSKNEGTQLKINNLKEKIRCVLCKRVCTDIIYHMKNYHKVGCISSIVSQCEKVTVDNTTTPVIVNARKINEVSEVIPEIEQFDLNEPLAVTVKKRKRNTPRWTIQKKKRKAVAETTLKTINPVVEGPFHCDICLGTYKSFRTFNHHQSLHRRRGETVDNFDPTQCRFLNSPLRAEKNISNSNISKEITPAEEYIPVQKETTKSQTVITDFITVQKGSMESQNGNPMISEDLNMEVDNQSEQTSCECGRSFRNYHTLYLHKVKCKGNNYKNKNINDSDSGIGISIKIKKNKNDSYEVVPQNTPIEDSYKSSKDSDASSNDSGMVSIDYNNQKTDTIESSNITNKSHSILRIQVAEDDEEVDIEDEDSNHSNSNECNFKSLNNGQVDSAAEMTLSSVKNDTFEQNMNHTARSTTKKNNSVPSLINLCKHVLSNSKEQDEQTPNYNCDTCSINFKNKTELLEHVSRIKDNMTNNCPCGKNFKNSKYFNIHVRRFHPLLLNCSYCMTNFDKIEKYLEHKCEVTEGKLFIEPILQTQCLKCKALVDIGEPYDKHMKTHFTEVTNYFQCFKCELKFDNPHQRRSHFSKEHGFAYCRICGKLLHIDYLSKHEAYHDGLGYPCHLCKKAFSQKTLLKKHVQNSHDPVVNEVVKCLVCTQSIKLKYLKKHMSSHLHTEICRKCNKCYRVDDQNQDLENHVALDHPYDYPTLKCEICKATFLSDKRYEEHSQKGSCKLDKNNSTNDVQSLTTN